MMPDQAEAISRKTPNRIARKFIWHILIFSSLITLIGTLVQLYMDYTRDIETIRANMNQIEISHLEGITNSVWNSDIKMIRIQLDGLMKLPDMQYLEIWEGGKHLASSGTYQDAHIISQIFPLRYTYKQKTIELGTLKVVSSLTGVYQRLLRKVLVILITQAIKTFLVSMFIFLIFQKLVGRHLYAMTNYTQTLDFENLETPLRLKRKTGKSNAPRDEIEQLVQSINQMRNNLGQSYHEIRKSNRALRESEQRFRQVLENSPIAMAIADEEEDIEYLNPLFTKTFGYTLKDIPSISDWWPLAYPDGQHRQEILETWQSAIEKARTEGQTLPPSQARITCKDGSLRWTEVTGGPVGNRNLVLFKDITREKEALDAVFAERERLKVTLRSIGDGVIATDTEGRVSLMNSVAEQLTGWPESEALNLPVSEIFNIINENTRKPCENPVEKVLETGGIVGLANGTVLISKQGRERVVADSGAPIVDINGKIMGVVLVFRDITELMELEAELRQAHKMEAIGTLAGGIAHEFNNVLGIILGNAELAEDDIEKWHPVSENLEAIKRAGFRARDVVRQLLDFSHKAGGVDKKSIDLKPIVRESLKFFRASFPASIEIYESLSSDTAAVMANPTQIHQLLVNLCTNASHAMDEAGGILEIELQNETISPADASRHPDLNPGDYVRLRVRDTGQGIEPAMADKIFDPYFTTKEQGKGTGMGLAVVHGIVKSHDGAILVDSKLGKGTCLTIYLPAEQGAASREISEEGAIPTGDERILFIDDDPSLTQMGKEILQRLGYQVTTENNPASALERVRSDPNAYDLIITDMTMPEMAGDKLAAEILSIRPEMPIIICTGFSKKLDKEGATAIGISRYIEKPINKRSLAVIIREVLGKERG